MIEPQMSAVRLDALGDPRGSARNDLQSAASALRSALMTRLATIALLRADAGDGAADRRSIQLPARARMSGAPWIALLLDVNQ